MTLSTLILAATLTATWSNTAPNVQTVFRGLPSATPVNSTNVAFVLEGAATANGKTSSWIIAKWDVLTNGLQPEVVKFVTNTVTVYQPTNFVIYAPASLPVVTVNQLDAISGVSLTLANRILLWGRQRKYWQ
ncbi:MAG: hypothetical protein WCS70_09035 [Verrucomicrobiota bacterium]